MRLSGRADVCYTVEVFTPPDSAWSRRSTNWWKDGKVYKSSRENLPTISALLLGTVLSA